ncbi:hypothetical protein NQZ79_g2416 [Umbelopsis isabellina]|nr:hypothetical protein NQZ79_g2416 [Umbelopsis isabellina]
MTGTSPKIRSLGLLEKYQVSKSIAECYGTVNLAVHLEHSTGWQDQDVQTWFLARLVPAIQQICDQEPLLSIVVANHDKSDVYLTQIAKLDVKDIVEFKTASFQDNTVFQELVAAESRHDFPVNDSSKPLWRLCVVTHPEDTKRCIIFYTWQHVIGDGMSSTMFFDKFLDIMNNVPVEQNPETAIKLQKIDDLPLPYDQRGSPKPNILTEVVPKAISALFTPKFIAQRLDAQRWAGEFNAKEEKHNSTVRTFEVSLDKLLLRCKSENVTPHCALYIAAITAASSELIDGSAKITTNTPVNARKFCNPEVPADEMGNFVGVLDNTIQVPLREPFWDEARKYRKKLKEDQRSEALATQYLGFLGSYPEEWVKFFKKPLTNSRMGRSGGLELSDLAWWQPKYGKGDWVVEKATFCQSINVYGVNMSLNAITVGSALRVSVVWQDGHVDATKVDQFISKIQNILKEQSQ